MSAYARRLRGRVEIRMKEIAYTLALEDVLAFARYQADRPRAVAVQLGLLCLIALLAMAGFFLSPPEARPAFSVWLPSVLAALLVLGGVVLFRHKLRAFVFRRASRKGAFDKLFTAHRLMMTPGAITSVTKFSAGAHTWEAIERIVVTERHAFFFVAHATAILLPKRVFAHEWEFAEFVETAERYRRQAVGK